MRRLILPTIAVIIILLGANFVAGKLAKQMHQNLGNLEVIQAKDGEGTISFSIKGYDEKTLLPGKEDFIQAEVKGKNSFNFVISPEDDSPVSAEYRIVQRNK